VIVFVNEQAEGMYAREADGLVWREAPGQAKVHLKSAVADGADRRFVPGLEDTVRVLDGKRELFSERAPFLWHPFLHHYGLNVQVAAEGPYDVRVRVEPPTWMRHDPKNGRRFAEPVEDFFGDLSFEPGRKPSPDAQPRGEQAPYARSG